MDWKDGGGEGQKHITYLYEMKYKYKYERFASVLLKMCKEKFNLHDVARMSQGV